MRAFQSLMSLAVVGIAAGLVRGQVSPVAMGDTVGAPRRASPIAKPSAPEGALKTNSTEVSLHLDPELTQRIIDLYESGQTDKAIELIELIAGGGTLDQALACPPGGWTFKQPSTEGYVTSGTLNLQGDLLIGRLPVSSGVGSLARLSSTDVPELADGPSNNGSIWEVDIPGVGEIRHVATDTDGFIYGAGRSLDPDRGMVVIKFAQTGGVIWQTKVFTGDPAFNGIGNIYDLVIGPEGIPVACNPDTVAQLDPFTGAIMWQTDEAPSNYSQLAVDSVGDVYLAKYVEGVCDLNQSGNLFGATSEVSKISGASGQRLWTKTSSDCGRSIQGSAGADPIEITLDRDENVIAVFGFSYSFGATNPTNFYVRKFAGDGTVLSEYTNPFAGSGSYTSAKTDPNGDTYVLTYEDDGGGSFYPTVYKIVDVGGLLQSVWNNGNGIRYAAKETSDTRNRVVLDRVGSPYLLINRSDDIWIAKLGPVGEVLFECVESSGSASIYAFEADNAGNLFAVWQDFTSNETVIKKVGQSLDLPIQFTASPAFALENRSVWPGNEGQVESEIEIFNPSWNQFFGIGGFIDSWFFDDTGARVGVNTSGDIYAGFKAEIEGGAMDMSFPIDTVWETGGTPVASGLPVNVDASWQMDPGASFSTSSEPEFNAGITGGLNFSVVPNVTVKFDGDDLLNENLFDPLELSLDRGYILSLGVFREFIDLAAADGEYVTVPTEIPGIGGIPGLDGISIKMRNPRLNAQGRFGGVAPFTGAASVSSFASNEIAEIDFSITNWLMNRYVETNPSLCPPLWQIPGTAANKLCELNKQIYTLDHGHGIDLGVISLNTELELLQMKLQATFEVNQGLNLEVTPKVRYEVTDGNGNPVPYMVRSGKTAQGFENQPVAGNPAVGTTLDFEAGSTLPDLQITMPSSGIIQITPYVYAETWIENDTGAGVIPGINWTLLKMGLNARAFGFGLPSFSLPDLSTRTDFGTIPISLYNEPAFVVKTPEIELAPFRIVGIRAGEEAPRLTAASRNSLPMIIYDQTSPSVSSFNSVTNGVSKMLLYGELFELVGEENIQPVVKIAHHGRVEVLASERINANTILAEVPNRFRLVPGVARMWVERNHFGVTQSTGTIDLPIEFPVPRLDAVNPNLWAADPDMFTIPMQVIDRKTLLGSDTFITRRDYYVKLRDELWNASTAGGTDAGAYFPCFDFDKMPEFPAVLFGTRNSFGQYEMNPLSRFIQPTDSGIHNVRLAERNYDTPGMVPVMICNPGPGGGVSETLMLNIAAPIPVASQLEPSEAEPGGELADGQFEMELIVRGPRHVPTWEDYEEPKFSNFNRDSVVYFDGEEVPTRFVDSSEIRAMVPDYLLQVEANYRVEVFTPHNGSKYLEKKWSDPDGDGVFDAPTLAAIDSGGWSAPIFFPVRWRPPEIETLNPPAIEMGNPAYAMSTPQNPVPLINFGVLGQNFRDGAVVLVNGEPRYTEFVSREMLNVRLEAQDVATLARRLISVRNPGWDPDESEMVELEITSPKAAPYTLRGP